MSHHHITLSAPYHITILPHHHITTSAPHHITSSPYYHISTSPHYLITTSPYYLITTTTLPHQHSTTLPYQTCSINCNTTQHNPWPYYYSALIRSQFNESPSFNNDPFILLLYPPITQNSWAACNVNTYTVLYTFVLKLTSLNDKCLSWSLHRSQHADYKSGFNNFRLLILDDA